jgi:hypothetical protein
LANDKLREAELLLRLYELYSSDSMVNAFTWFYKDFRAKNVEDFEKLYPLGTEGRKYFWKIGNFFDLLGTFLKRNYLPKELIMSYCPDDVRSYWKTTKDIVIQMRGKWDDPMLYADLELLSREIEEWYERLKENRQDSRPSPT